MLKYAYELGAAAAYHDFAKEAAWPGWLKGLLASVGSKATNPATATRRGFMFRPVTRALRDAAIALPEAAANYAALGGLTVAAKHTGEAALKNAPDLTRRGFLEFLGLAGLAGATSAAGRTARSVEQATGNILDDLHTMGSIGGGDISGSSTLAKRLRMLSKARKLAPLLETNVSELTRQNLNDTASLAGDVLLDIGPFKGVSTLLGGPAHLGFGIKNPLPGVL